MHIKRFRLIPPNLKKKALRKIRQTARAESSEFPPKIFAFRNSEPGRFPGGRDARARSAQRFPVAHFPKEV
ncbi:MAG: hypothetical protein H7Z39_19540 [Burkholderiaceae bacterium]|nr:hypothetical protein [Burkholderiaceae bacterium]